MTDPSSTDHHHHHHQSVCFPVNSLAYKEAADSIRSTLLSAPTPLDQLLARSPALPAMPGLFDLKHQLGF